MSNGQKYRIDIPAYKEWYHEQNGRHQSIVFTEQTVVTVGYVSGETAFEVSDAEGLGAGEMPFRFLIPVGGAS